MSSSTATQWSVDDAIREEASTQVRKGGEVQQQQAEGEEVMCITNERLINGQKRFGFFTLIAHLLEHALCMWDGEDYFAASDADIELTRTMNDEELKEMASKPFSPNVEAFLLSIDSVEFTLEEGTDHISNYECYEVVLTRKG